MTRVTSCTCNTVNITSCTEHTAGGAADTAGVITVKQLDARMGEKHVKKLFAKFGTGLINVVLGETGAMGLGCTSLRPRRPKCWVRQVRWVLVALVYGHADLSAQCAAASWCRRCFEFVCELVT